MKNITVLLLIFFLSACATYTTPASGVDVSSISDVDIAELMAREPQAQFPSRMAVVRIQAPGYTSRTNSAYGTGEYSVITTRDIEDETSIAGMADWSGLHSVAPIGRLLLPRQLDSMKDLRIAAAKLRTDLVLVYSIDTAFHIEGQPMGALGLIKLGFVKNKQAHVSTTTSGAIIDVRTGFVYGVSEATEKEQQGASIWSTEEAIDQARLKSEAESFKSFIKETKKLWSNIVLEHG